MWFPRRMLTSISPDYRRATAQVRDKELEISQVAHGAEFEHIAETRALALRKLRQELTRLRHTEANHRRSAEMLAMLHDGRRR